jgi:hypothetical protein
MSTPRILPPDPDDPGEHLDCPEDPMANVFSELADHQQHHASHRDVDPYLTIARREQDQRQEDLERIHKTTASEATLEPRMKWLGSQRKLAGWFLQAFHDGELDSHNQQDVYRQIAAHFVDKDGNDLDPESLRSNIALQQLEIRGKRKK